MDSIILDERDGWLYVKHAITDFFEPRLISNWFPMGTRYREFEQYFESQELARAAIGKTLEPLTNGRYLDERGWILGLEDRGQTKSSHVEITPIPEPKQRGKKLPMEWRRGAWYKLTAKGWVRA